MSTSGRDDCATGTPQLLLAPFSNGTQTQKSDQAVDGSLTMTHRAEAPLYDVILFKAPNRKKQLILFPCLLLPLLKAIFDTDALSCVLRFFFFTFRPCDIILAASECAGVFPAAPCRKAHLSTFESRRERVAQLSPGLAEVV